MIGYDDLRAALDISTDEEMEHVVIQAIYAGLIHVRNHPPAASVLCPRHGLDSLSLTAALIQPYCARTYRCRRRCVPNLITGLA